MPPPIRTALLSLLLPWPLAGAAGEPAPPAEAPKKLLQWNLGAALAPPPGTVVLDPVQVTGRRDAFGEADQRLRKLAETLPCTGCGGDAAGEQRGLVEKVLTGTRAALAAALVAPENAGEPHSIEDRALQDAEDRRFLPANKLP